LPWLRKSLQKTFRAFFGAPKKSGFFSREMKGKTKTAARKEAIVHLYGKDADSLTAQKKKRTSSDQQQEREGAGVVV